MKKKIILIAVLLLMWVISENILLAQPISPEGNAPRPFILRLIFGLLGISTLLFIAYIFSTNRKAIRWRTVACGVMLQFVFGLIILSPKIGDGFFKIVDRGITKLLSFSEEGTAFVLQGVRKHKVIKNYDGNSGKLELETYPQSGAPLLSLDDLVDAPSLITKLKKAETPLARHLVASFSIEFQAKLRLDSPISESIASLQDQLNDVLRRENLYSKDMFKDIVLRKQTQYYLDQNPKGLTLVKLNRLLLEDAYPEIGKATITDEVFIPKVSPIAKTFAFWVLPTIIFFATLMTVLYHWGVMQQIVKLFAWIMQKTMHTSGAESLSAAANIFVGQTEAPLVIRPFVEKMTNSELHAIMVGGFATVAGGVMAVYVSVLQGCMPGIAGHLMVASIMAAPAGLVIAKMLFPETDEPLTMGKLKVEIERPDANTIEAAARGATDGMKLMINVVAVLIAFVGLIALINHLLHFIAFPSAWTADGSGYLSLQTVLGWLFYPIALIMGVPLKDCFNVGILLGEKIALTELLAFVHLGDLASQHLISPRAAIISSYALCGFANIASIGIQIGGIGSIAPSRRSDLAKLGLRAMCGGAIATCMAATIAGILINV